MRATVLTRRGDRDLRGPVHELLALARERDVTLCLDENEVAKHGLRDEPGVEVCPVGRDVDVCVVLGGDGTILGALREYAGTDVPVFAVNYGEVGFLATMDPDGLREGLALAFSGEFETMALPSSTVGRPDASWFAFNDISVHRQPGRRVADLAYGVGGEEIGRVRCDGLVVSTPAGSTGYNLANGGPVLAWGVEGYVVSFIAPHSFTARALFVAPDDAMTITNASHEDEVEVRVDGRPASTLSPTQDITVEFGSSSAQLAQLPGASFYHRLRERFGRLAR
ncbi:MAG: NAD(+)/NADH kinase [Solirubrobacteraceae bacterium]